MKRWTTISLALATLALSASAQTALDIVKEHETAKIAALEAYLAANADATDVEDAQDALLAGYALTEQSKKGAAIFAARYETLDKGEDASPRDIALGFVQPYFAFLMQGRMKDEAKTFAATFKKDFADHPQGEALIEFVNDNLSEFNKPQIGDVMEIAGTDTNGNAIDLAAMKGKVVLVDFWATWCGPCKVEIPHVKEAYKEYHDKGFEVIAVSLDKSLETLAAYTKKNEMPWPQLCDGKAWETELTGKYGITGIPATFLIGKDGTIVATDLRGSNLGKQIAKHLE